MRRNSRAFAASERDVTTFTGSTGRGRTVENAVCWDMSIGCPLHRRRNESGQQ